MTDHQHPTAKPEGEGAPGEMTKASEVMDLLRSRTDPFVKALNRAQMDDADRIDLAYAIIADRKDRASPPVPAVAGEWDSLIDYLENQTAKTDEGRAIIAEWIAQAKALNCPTPEPMQADLRETIARIEEIATWLESGDPGAEGSVLFSASVAQEHATDLKAILSAMQAKSSPSAPNPD